ncbi:hypothetical protein AAC03nite_35840 [Alicyclobacillus acidoterrestris]|uniref:hypothetical protein n=1 Tax=Alicyclobacillus suci TaxID=2816080 RepID=UPI0011909846|nr:hypothetical protein [Alicyclobacillus suci]GEO27799.1 hypothetical protein AAC03nite_35840 [Alicyclobacillus acidoterrestris]
MQMQEWIDLGRVSELVGSELLYDADAMTKLRHANRATQYFPSNGKKRSKYYTPPRNDHHEV